MLKACPMKCELKSIGVQLNTPELFHKFFTWEQCFVALLQAMFSSFSIKLVQVIFLEF